MTWIVRARKDDGPWQCVLRTHDKAHAEAICKATHRGKWESILVCEEAPGINPLPPSCNNQYEMTGFKVTWYCPTGEMYLLKNGEEREKIVPMFQLKVHVKHLQSGMTWVYTGNTKYGRVRWTDSREKNKTIDMGCHKGSIRDEAFQAQITKMVGTESQIDYVTIPMGDYRQMIGA